MYVYLLPPQVKDSGNWKLTGWGSILDTVAKDTEDTGGVSILSLS